MTIKEFNNFKIKNVQQNIAVTAWVLSAIFLFPMILPFYEDNPISGAWALSFISLFLMVSAIVTAVIFRSRSKKMNELLNGNKLISSWKMNTEMREKFLDETSSAQKNKSKMLIRIVGIFFLVFTILFLLFLDADERLLFFLIMFSVFLMIFFASGFFPWLYRYKNLKGDGIVLIGSKYIYINGNFHNWDFPMSGLEKLKAIDEPFRGILLKYYFTDRTGPNSFELKIPVPEDIDTDLLVFRIKNKT